MSAIDRLLTNYSRQVRLPWSASMSGKQRVWFAVYPPAEERRVRARQPQFEATTLEAQRGWLNVDLTDLLPQWIAAHEYREGSYALGCTRWQTIWNVVLKSAAPSLMTAVPTHSRVVAEGMFHSSFPVAGS